MVRNRLVWHHGPIITSAIVHLGGLTLSLYSGVDAFDGRWSVEVRWRRRKPTGGRPRRPEGDGE